MEGTGTAAESRHTPPEPEELLLLETKEGLTDDGQGDDTEIIIVDHWSVRAAVLLVQLPQRQHSGGGVQLTTIFIRTSRQLRSDRNKPPPPHTHTKKHSKPLNLK